MRTGESVFLRADGRWEARYQKSRDENGKIKYGFVYGSTKEEAEKKRSQALTKLMTEEAIEATSVLPSANHTVPIMPDIGRKPKVRNTEKFEEPLTAEQFIILESLLDNSSESIAVGLYLSLHMGLSLAEISALRYGDIDCTGRIVHVRLGIKASGQNRKLIPITKRDLPMPRNVQSFLLRRDIQDKSPDFFVLTDHETKVISSRTIATSFRKLTKDSSALDDAAVGALRCTFIKNCLAANMNIESVSLITGVDKVLLYRYFGKYIKADMEAIVRTDDIQPTGDKHLSLLILGAGSHGHNVKETAEKLGIFHEIKFLDDGIEGADILDRCECSNRYSNRFPCAFVAIGDNEIRQQLIDKLRSEGYLIPKIIHPDATVSQNAVIGDGTVVLAQATVDAAVVGENCIIASNALISRGAVVGNGVHVDCGGIILKSSQVPEGTTVNSGEIFSNQTA